MIKLKYIVLVSTLLVLVGCSTKQSEESTLMLQSELLTRFGASLEKIVSIDGKGTDTIYVAADSVKWDREVSFLPYLDLLTESNFVIDSVKSNVFYTPKDTDGDVLSASCSFKKKSRLYKILVDESNLISSSKKEFDIEFKGYGEDNPVLSSYVVAVMKKNTFGKDSLVYKVEAKVMF